MTSVITRPITCLALSALAASLFHMPMSIAQGLYSGSSLHINGASIHIDGEIFNSGILHNEGVISFTGDWESKGQYKGDGIVEAIGTAPQVIAHHDQRMSRLIVNGWGTKYIKGRLNLSRELHLQKGIVEVSSKDVLRLKEEALATGGSPDSFVDGALTVTGNGYKFFPIGKHGNYAPIEFLSVEGVPAEYSVEVFENAPLITLDNVIVRKALYWQRRDVVGKFGSSTVAVEFEPAYFENPEEIILVTGTDWQNPFSTVSDVKLSEETNKIVTSIAISSPIIMLGEISQKWADADFYFSTALSPNAARPENRAVKIFGERLAEDSFHFQVFNRWGELVYENSSLAKMSSNGWDGRSLNGSELNGGTYPYRLTALDKTGKKFEKTGVITIIH